MVSVGCYSGRSRTLMHAAHTQARSRPKIKLPAIYGVAKPHANGWRVAGPHGLLATINHDLLQIRVIDVAREDLRWGVFAIRQGLSTAIRRVGNGPTRSQRSIEPHVRVQLCIPARRFQTASLGGSIRPKLVSVLGRFRLVGGAVHANALACLNYATHGASLVGFNDPLKQRILLDKVVVFTKRKALRRLVDSGMICRDEVFAAFRATQQASLIFIRMA